jgi:hypothetical protein
VRQLNAFVALSEADPAFRQRLSDCASHQEVVELAGSCGFDIARRWGEPPTPLGQPATIGVAPGDFGLQGTSGQQGPGGHQRPDLSAQDQATPDQHPADPSPQVSGSQVARSQISRSQMSSARVVDSLSIGSIKPSSQDTSAWAAQHGGAGLGPNLFSGPCPAPGQERSDGLLVAGPLRLELIHSCDFANPPGFWYDQSETEWVTLLQGSARLRFADESEVRQLQPGDTLVISPGRRHRVEATDPAPGTRWLALFWSVSG